MTVDSNSESGAVMRSVRITCMGSGPSRVAGVRLRDPIASPLNTQILKLTQEGRRRRGRIKRHMGAPRQLAPTLTTVSDRLTQTDTQSDRLRVQTFNFSATEVIVLHCHGGRIFGMSMSLLLGRDGHRRGS